MTVRDDRGDVKQTTAGFRGPLMVQSLTSAKSKFLSLSLNSNFPNQDQFTANMVNKFQNITIFLL